MQASSKMPPSTSNADDNYVVLPLYFPRKLRRLSAISTFGILVFLVMAYALWPSDPDMKIVRMRVTSLRVRTRPHVEVDMSVSLTVNVRNDDVYSLDYAGLDVAVGYRGKTLGHVLSERGHMSAKGSSFVEVELDLYGIRVFSDVVFLLEDLAKGAVRFDTLTVVDGHLGLLFLKIPLQAKVSCEVSINTIDQTILRQNCYSE